MFCDVSWGHLKESPRCKAHVRLMYVHTTYIFTYMSGSRVASIVPNNRPWTFHILYKDDRAGRVTRQGSTPCMALRYRVTIVYQ